MFYVCLFIISVTVTVLAYCFHLLASNYWLWSYRRAVNPPQAGSCFGERHNKSPGETEVPWSQLGFVASFFVSLLLGFFALLLGVFLLCTSCLLWGFFPCFLVWLLVFFSLHGFWFFLLLVLGGGCGRVSVSSEN